MWRRAAGGRGCAGIGPGLGGVRGCALCVLAKEYLMLISNLYLIVVVTAVVPTVTMTLAVFGMQVHVSQADNAALSQRSRRRLRYSCRLSSPTFHHLTAHSSSYLYFVS